MLHMPCILTLAVQGPPAASAASLVTDQTDYFGVLPCPAAVRVISLCGAKKDERHSRTLLLHTLLTVQREKRGNASRHGLINGVSNGDREIPHHRM